MRQQRDALLKEKETAEKIAARAFAQSYLADLIPSVFSTLSQGGFFYDPVERGTWKRCSHLAPSYLCFIFYICRGGVSFRAMANAGSRKGTG